MINNGGTAEVSQDAAAEDGGGGVNSRDGSDGGDRAGVGRVGDTFRALCRPLDKLNSKLVSLDWFCIAHRCLGHC